MLQKYWCVAKFRWVLLWNQMLFFDFQIFRNAKNEGCLKKKTITQLPKLALEYAF
jgi:hypothetical protein